MGAPTRFVVRNEFSDALSACQRLDRTEGGSNAHVPNSHGFRASTIGMTSEPPDTWLEISQPVGSRGWEIDTGIADD